MCGAILFSNIRSTWRNGKENVRVKKPVYGIYSIRVSVSRISSYPASTRRLIPFVREHLFKEHSYHFIPFVNEPLLRSLISFRPVGRLDYQPLSEKGARAPPSNSWLDA